MGFPPLQPSDFVDMSKWAVLVVDMWDFHPCDSARAHNNELAPRINEFLNEARRRNALIVHAPSNTGSGQVKATYANSPARRLALDAPATALPKYAPLQASWMPIDDTGGGCEGGSSANPSNPAHPWDPMREHPAIAINENVGETTDAIVHDNELQILYNLLKSRQRTHVLVLGVALNECVLTGRGWSIDGLAGLASVGAIERVALVRDLTDTMYNQVNAPYINHFAGTDLVVRFYEQYYCPTIQSSWLLQGQPPFRFQQDKRPTSEPWVGHQVYLSSTGSDGTKRRLYGDDFQVQVAQPWQSATKWYAEAIAPSVYAFSYHHPKNPLLTDLYLAGEPPQQGVDAAPDVQPPLTEYAGLTRSWSSTRWWYAGAVPAAGGQTLYRLKCCGRDSAVYRFLTIDPKGLLILQENGNAAGTLWQIEIA